jgi:hypothetical protein
MPTVKGGAQKCTPHLHSAQIRVIRACSFGMSAMSAHGMLHGNADPLRPRISTKGADRLAKTIRWITGGRFFFGFVA